MTLVLDATVGGPAANSWASVQEFRAWADGRPNVDLSDVDDDACALVLVGGTSRLEQETYEGSRTSITQVLSFPRYGLTRDGIFIPSDVIPMAAKYALFEEAAALLADPTRYERSRLTQFDRVAVGPLDLAIRDTGVDPNQLTPGAERWLGLWRSGSEGSFQFLRST